MLFLALLSSFTKGQNPTYDKEYYYKKGVRQQNTGFILFGVGSIMTVVGYEWFNRSSFWDDEWAAPLTLVIVGGVATAASIPFVIIGGKNKRIAKSMAGVTFIPTYLYDINKPMVSSGIFYRIPIHGKKVPLKAVHHSETGMPWKSK
jgi:hypothetical protein